MNVIGNTGMKIIKTNQDGCRCLFLYSFLETLACYAIMITNPSPRELFGFSSFALVVPNNYDIHIEEIKHLYREYVTEVLYYHSKQLRRI